MLAFIQKAINAIKARSRRQTFAFVAHLWFGLFGIGPLMGLLATDSWFTKPLVTGRIGYGLVEM